jgi:hypothetical protein
MLHKLADGPYTMQVGGIEMTEGKFGPQYRVVGTDGTEIYLSETAVHRGLERLKLTQETVLGETLTFYQVKKDGKTYTNIDRPTSASAQAAAAGAAPAATPPSAPRTARSLEELEELYGRCLDVAMRTLVKRCEEFEIPIDGAAVQAATATLFIASK